MNAILQALIGYFPTLLDVSMTASIVILFVICARLILKRASKIFSYALWGVVLLRLLVPISIESPVSVVPTSSVIYDIVEIAEVLPEIEFVTPQDYSDNAGHVESTSPVEPPVQASKSIPVEMYLTFAWFIGIAIMVLHSIVTYWKLRKRLKVAIPIQKRIFIADNINTPFVMGLFRPAIFLPTTLEETERKYIIAHEQHHIRRGDHIFKALGLLALTIHWFNPLVWIAFVLAGRDMEMSCDEAVIRKLGADIRADYSASLLNLAIGHRLFSITPLAFGEGNPTGRVRNLAKWKKPAFLVTIICAVLCIALAVCLLTDPESAGSEGTDSSETSSTNPVETFPPEMGLAENDWGIALALHGASSNGAGWYFINDGTTNGELTYDRYFSLEQKVDGGWTAPNALIGADLAGQIFTVENGIGWYVEWPSPIGHLTDGHYRFGKNVTLTSPDGSSQERMFYYEFSLENGVIPLEDLPENYAYAIGDQPAYDGCFIQSDGRAMINKQFFKEFADVTQGGIPSFIRIVNYYYGKTDRHTIHDLEFDGSRYTISWMEDGKRQSKQYQYLKSFTGDKEEGDSVGIDYDAFEHLVLVNDEIAAWEDVRDGNNDMDCMFVYSDYIYYYDRHYESADIPDNVVRADLEFEGETLITVTDADRLEDLADLFDTAEVLYFEPKTHSLGVELYLILACQDGETVTIELDPDNDICRMDGSYIHYGRYDEPSYIHALWQYLGVSAWPDPVYGKYPGAYRP